MTPYSELIKYLSESAPTAFFGVILATYVAYLMSRVRIVEGRKLRELEEKQLVALRKQVTELTQQLHVKDERINALHDQIMSILGEARAAGPKEDAHDNG